MRILSAGSNWAAKKRKAEDGEGSTVSSPAKSTKGKAKRKHSQNDSPGEARTIIKKVVDGLAAGLAMPAFASSPALLHMSDATYNPGDKLHQRNISQGRRLIRLDSFTLLRLVREPVANVDCATPNSWQLERRCQRRPSGRNLSFRLRRPRPT